MKIDITAHRHDPEQLIQLFLNGKLASEILLGKVEGVEDLEGRVRKANVATSLMRSARERVATWEKASKADRAAFLRGIADGFADDHTVPHPGNFGVSRMPKEPAVEYEAGSSLATFIRRCVDVAYGREIPTPEAPNS